MSYMFRARERDRLQTLALAVAVVFAALAVGPILEHAEAAAFGVTKTLDTADGSCDSDCSLREAIVAANAGAGKDTVAVPAGRYRLTIEDPLTGVDTAASGDLDIDAGVSIRGSGAPSTIVDQRAEDRVFQTPARPGSSPFTATMSGLTVTSGFPFAGGDSGGGIYHERRNATLNLAQVAVRGNLVVAAGGGGIANRGKMRIDRSTISHNSGSFRGSFGGGIANSGALELTNTTVSGNDSFTGGGIANSGALELTNTTVSRNEGFASGGGVRQGGGTLTARNSTIAFNSHFEPDDGATGGIGVFGGATSFKNTIVARNVLQTDNGSRPSNCNDAVGTNGNNLENGTSCGFTRRSDVRADPRLGPLQNNGGHTRTHRLLRGSPAIDAGGAPFPPTDQRGVARPQGRASDIGAFEAAARKTDCTIGRGDGNDIIRGTPGDDVICAGGGNDVVYGGGGNDTIRGVGGNDVLRGGEGNDRLSGGAGNDVLRGEEGRDFLDTRDNPRGNDVANGGPGGDRCLTGPGDARYSC